MIKLLKKMIYGENKPMTPLVITIPPMVVAPKEYSLNPENELIARLATSLRDRIDEWKRHEIFTASSRREFELEGLNISCYIGWLEQKQFSFNHIRVRMVSDIDFYQLTESEAEYLNPYLIALYKHCEKKKADYETLQKNITVNKLLSKLDQQDSIQFKSSD